VQHHWFPDIYTLIMLLCFEKDVHHFRLDRWMIKSLMCADSNQFGWMYTSTHITISDVISLSTILCAFPNIFVEKL